MSANDTVRYTVNTLLTFVRTCIDAFHILDCAWWKAAYQLSSECGRLSRRVRLPHVVLVRVGVVRDAADDQAASVNVDTCCLHLNAERPATSRTDSIPQLAILNDCVASCDPSLMENECILVLFCSKRSLDELLWIACRAAQSIRANVAMASLEELVVFKTRVCKFVVSLQPLKLIVELSSA